MDVEEDDKGKKEEENPGKLMTFFDFKSINYVIKYLLCGRILVSIIA